MLGLRAFESVRERPFFHNARLLGVFGVVGVSVGEGGRLCVASWCVWANGSEFRKECDEEAVMGVGFEYELKEDLRLFDVWFVTSEVRFEKPSRLDLRVGWAGLVLELCEEPVERLFIEAFWCCIGGAAREFEL